MINKVITVHLVAVVVEHIRILRVEGKRRSLVYTSSGCKRLVHSLSYLTAAEVDAVHIALLGIVLQY